MESYNVRESIFLQDSQHIIQEPNLVVLGPAYGYYHPTEIGQSDISRSAGQELGHDFQRNTLLHSKPENINYVHENWQKNLSMRFYDRCNDQTVRDYSLNTGTEKCRDSLEQNNLKKIDLQEQKGIQIKQCHEVDKRQLNENQEKFNEIRDSYCINQSISADSSNLIPLSNKQDGHMEIVKCEEAYNTKLYTCGQCGRQFDIVCNLHQHLLTHKSSGLYIFNIDTLTAYFKDEGIYKAVKTIHQSEDEERVKGIDWEQSKDEESVKAIDWEQSEDERIKRPDWEQSENEERVKSLDLEQSDDKERVKAIDWEQRENDFKISITYQTSDGDVDHCNKELDESENFATTNERKWDKVKGDRNGLPKKKSQYKTKRKTDDLEYKSKNGKERSCRTSKMGKTTNSDNTGDSLNERKMLHKTDTKHLISEFGKIVDEEFLESDNDFESCSNYNDVTVDLDYTPSVQNDKSYKCEVCGKKFKFKAKLNLHRDYHHNDINIDYIKKVSHNCKWCQESFTSRKLMYQHVKECLKNDRLKCYICEVIIPSKAERLKHLHSHDNLSDLTCKICNKVMKNLVLMQAHMKRHNRKNVVQCDQCGKAFLYKHLLKKHAAYCHNEHPIECPKCDKKFRTKEAMKHHISVHSEEKLYVCHFCGYTGKKLNYLKRHMRTHTGERPYSCNSCGKTFVSANGLNRHKKIHTNKNLSVCQYCGKSFTNNWNLKTHIRQHTGDTPYKCRECGMGFKQNVLVKLHMKSHHPTVLLRT